jgi:hypothetical protein
MNSALHQPVSLATSNSCQKLLKQILKAWKNWSKKETRSKRRRLKASKTPSRPMFRKLKRAKYRKMMYHQST